MFRFRTVTIMFVCVYVCDSCLCCYVFNLVIENKQETCCGSPNILEEELFFSFENQSETSLLGARETHSTRRPRVIKILIQLTVRKFVISLDSIIFGCGSFLFSHQYMPTYRESIVFLQHSLLSFQRKYSFYGLLSEPKKVIKKYRIYIFNQPHIGPKSIIFLKY